MAYEINTICVQGNGKRKYIDNTGAISFPIYQTASFAHPGVGQSTGYDYSRAKNPTREELERIVTELENGVDAVAFSSGMSAFTVLMERYKPGDHIIATDDLYGGTVRAFSTINKKNGIEVSYVDTSRIELIRQAIRKETKAIYIETPTNPTMKVADIKAIAKLAKKSNCDLIVDNTFLTPYFQKPLELGANIVLHSGTKYLAGHNDTLSGFLITSDEEIAKEFRELSMTIGCVLSPFDSWLVLRGIKTLGIRMERHQKNALALVKWLKSNDKVKRVYYIGMPEHPGYEIITRQCTGYGGMISFRVESEELAKQILSKVKLIQFAESLGGVETLLTYPTMQTHADVPKEIKDQLGINETLLRLSVGIESVNDLVADLKQAFEA